MSLYNQMCGNNPLFGIFARVLETAGQLPPIPRFRDTYTRESDGKPQIVIYTRTGGGNRNDYGTENKAITNHPCYVEDHDDNFDGTFAHWVFSVPEPFAERILRLHRAFSKFPKGQTPKQKFDRSMRLMDGRGDESPDPTVAEIEELSDAISSLVVDLPQSPSSLEKSLLQQSA